MNRYGQCHILRLRQNLYRTVCAQHVGQILQAKEIHPRFDAGSSNYRYTHCHNNKYLRATSPLSQKIEGTDRPQYYLTIIFLFRLETKLFRRIMTPPQTKGDDKKRRKRVCFADDEHIASIFPTHQPVMERQTDCEALWFSPKELSNTVQECRDEISRCVIPEDESSLRGLELVTGYNQASSFLKQRQEWTRSVLQEQARQQQECRGIVSMLQLPPSMLQTCEHRQRVAHLRGLQDAQAVHGVKTLPQNIVQNFAETRERRRAKRTERRSRIRTA